MADQNQNPLMPLSTVPEDEQFVSSEVFLDAQCPLDWDALVTRGNVNNTQGTTKWERDSLYVKFDPLVTTGNPADRASFMFKVPKVPPPPASSTVSNINESTISNEAYKTALDFSMPLIEEGEGDEGCGAEENGNSPYTNGSQDEAIEMALMKGSGLSPAEEKEEGRLLNETVIMSREPQINGLTGESNKSQDQDKLESLELNKQETILVFPLMSSSNAEREVDNFLDGAEQNGNTSHRVSIGGEDGTFDMSGLAERIGRLRLSVGKEEGRLLNETQVMSRESPLHDLIDEHNGGQDTLESLEEEKEELSRNFSNSSPSPIQEVQGNDVAAAEDAGDSSYHLSGSQDGEGDIVQVDDELKEVEESFARLSAEEKEEGRLLSGMEMSPELQIGQDKLETLEQEKQEKNRKRDEDIIEISRLKESIARLSAEDKEEGRLFKGTVMARELQLNGLIDECSKAQDRLECLELEKQLRIQERDEALENVRYMEAAFAKMLMMYEEIKTSQTQAEENCQILEGRQEMWTHAVEHRDTRDEAAEERFANVLELLKQDFECRVNERNAENMKLNATLRMTDMKTSKLEAEIRQLETENDKLRKLCEDLTKS